MIRINYNGSKFAGDAPDDIDALLARMRDHAIAPFWLDGDFCETGVAPDGDDTAHEPVAVRFGGNFTTYSHAFSIDTDEPELIARLRAAVRANVEKFYGSAAGVASALREENAARERRRLTSRERQR